MEKPSIEWLLQTIMWKIDALSPEQLGEAQYRLQLLDDHLFAMIEGFA